MKTRRMSALLSGCLAVFLLAGSVFLTPPAVHATGTTAPATLYDWQNTSGSWSTPTNVAAIEGLPQSIVSPLGLTHNNSDPATHAFTVDVNGHLWDSFSPNPFQSPPSFTAFDISAFTNSPLNTTAGAEGVGALYLGGSNPSTQVFAIGTTTKRHLLAFTTSGDGGSWQVSDLSVLSGSGASLTTTPNPIQVGSTVHVYVTDNNKHLHDFYKPINANWTDQDLTNQTSVHAIFGRPYFYGGNSIQTVSTSDTGDLETFVQVVNPDGTINFGAGTSVTDITQVSGTGIQPKGTPSPVVVGSTVTIFVDSTSDTLVEFFKTPTDNWQVFKVANLGKIDLTPSALFANGVLHVVTNNNQGVMFDYTSTTLAPPFTSSALPNSIRPALGDPSLVNPGQGSSLLTFNIL